MVQNNRTAAEITPNKRGPQIIYCDTNSLVPYINNARTHTDEQVAQIAASIKEFGWTNPILTDGTNGVIAGHGRLLAARKLDIAEVPCVALDSLTEAQRKAYVLADNKLALNAGWDNALLGMELSALQAMDFDLSLTGFSDLELDALVVDRTEGLADPDEVPEPPEDPIAKPGDLWICGNHRVLCGDSTSAGDVGRLFDGGVADLLFTSPPYAQQRDYGVAKDAVQDWDGLMNGVFSVMPVKDGAQVLVNLGLVHDHGRVNSYWDTWLQYMDENGWPLFGWYVWDKGFGAPGNWHGRLAPSHEFVFHFAKSASQSNKWVEKQEKYVKARRKDPQFRQKDGSLKKATSPLASLQKNKVADSVIRVTPEMARGTHTKGHPAVFPVALCEYIYKSFAKVGDIIYEPFCGAGTSVVACEQFGAKCYGMEIDPAYVDVIVTRWQNFTGQEASREN